MGGMILTRSPCAGGDNLPEAIDLAVCHLAKEKALHDLIQKQLGFRLAQSCTVCSYTKGSNKQLFTAEVRIDELLFPDSLAESPSQPSTLNSQAVCPPPPAQHLKACKAKYCLH